MSKKKNGNKEFTNNYGIGCLRRIGILDPPMNVGMGIKNTNPMGIGIEIINGYGDGESKILPKSDPLPS